jgi:membrane protein DedA with SNARE-associated domain
MTQPLSFLGQHGPALLFLIVLAEMLGLPLPAVPVLVAMGAMAGEGRFSFATGLVIAVSACLTADVIWYRLGRWRGARVLTFLCRISLEPDSCVRTAENVLAARGPRALLFAKFLPGLSTVATPVAGLIHMPAGRFLFWDVLGSLLWSSAYMTLGWVFHDQLEKVLAAVTDVGSTVFRAAVGLVVAYVAWKLAQRRRFRAQTAVDRITPEELRGRLASGEDLLVVDLRHEDEFAAERMTVPGALRVAPDTIDAHVESFRGTREVVLFCT